jgi:ABC-type multidrug transport system ATPase subunit
MVKSATALENLKTAQHAKIDYDVLSGLGGAPASWREERELEEKADAILDLLDLSAIRNSQVGALSYGTLKLLELGCALATDPEILLLDEPSSGMGPDESDELGERLLTLRKEFGLTMLLIEHHVPLVLRVCDHVYVLNFGRLLAEGEPSVIQTHPEVVAAYLGGEAPEALAKTHETAEDEALEAATTRPARKSAPRKAAAKAPAKAAAKAPAAWAAPAAAEPARAPAGKVVQDDVPAARKTTARKPAAPRKIAPAGGETATPAVAKKAPAKKAAAKRTTATTTRTITSVQEPAAPTRKAASRRAAPASSGVPPVESPEPAEPAAVDEELS